MALSKIKTDQQIKVTATSAAKKCTTTFDIQHADSSTGIVNKQTLEGSNFKVDPTTGLYLNLKDYYGGPNLRYMVANVSNDNTDFDVSVKQVDSYTFKPSFGIPEKYSILSLNQESFYFLGINSVKERKAYVDICRKSKETISC